MPNVRDLAALLDTLQARDGSPLPAGLRARLQREWEHAQFLYGKTELERETLGIRDPGARARGAVRIKLPDRREEAYYFPILDRRIDVKVNLVHARWVS